MGWGTSTGWCCSTTRPGKPAVAARSSGSSSYSGVEMAAARKRWRVSSKTLTAAMAPGRMAAAHADVGAAGLGVGGLQPQHALGGVGGPQLHGRRVEQAGGGGGDAPEHVVHDQRLADELFHLGQLAQPVGAAGGVGEH